jgi:hypothetical protein
MSKEEQRHTPQDEAQDKEKKVLNRRTFDGIVDQRLTKAMEEGQFDNLPGAGKPLQRDEDALVPDDLRAGFGMLKANGFAPGWIETRKDIDEERRKLALWLTETNSRWPKLSPERRRALRAEYRSKLEAVRSMILTYNLQIPGGVGQLVGLNIQEELSKLGDKYPFSPS